MATYQPRFSSPTRLRTGTRTFSKNVSLNGSSQHMSVSGCTVMPGVSFSISRNEIPRCFGASGSLRTRTNSHSANCAPEVQIFCPLTT